MSDPWEGFATVIDAPTDDPWAGFATVVGDPTATTPAAEPPFREYSRREQIANELKLPGADTTALQGELADYEKESQRLGHELTPYETSLYDATRNKSFPRRVAESAIGGIGKQVGGAIATAGAALTGADVFKEAAAHIHDDKLRTAAESDYANAGSIVKNAVQGGVDMLAQGAFGAAVGGTLPGMAAYFGGTTAADNFEKTHSYGQAATHGLIDAAWTFAGGKYLGAALGKLAGGESAGRAAGYLTQKIGLPKLAAEGIEGVSGQVLQGVGQAVSHYTADWGAGQHEWDNGELWKEVEGVLGPSVVAGLGGTAVHALKGYVADIGSTVQSRQRALPAATRAMEDAAQIVTEQPEVAQKLTETEGVPSRRKFAEATGNGKTDATYREAVVEEVTRLVEEKTNVEENRGQTPVPEEGPRQAVPVPAPDDAQNPVDAGEGFALTNQPEPAPPAQVGENVPAEEPAGSVGAATPKEIEAHRGTALKNEAGDWERLVTGLPEATPAEVQAMKPAMERAKEASAIDPFASQRLVEELIADPERGLSGDDSALLLKHKADLLNAKNEAAKATHTAETPEAKAEAEKAYQQHSDDLLDLLNAIQERGSNVGREFRWRQALLLEDYSFEAMAARKQAAVGKRALTPAETKAVKKLQAKIETSDGPKAEALKKQFNESLYADKMERRLKEESALLDEQLRTGVVPPKEKRVRRPTPEHLERLEFDVKTKREKIRQKLDRELPKSKWRKLNDALQISVALRTAFDLSAFGVQNTFSTISHPILGVKNLWRSMNAMKSEAYTHEVMEELHNRVRAPLWDKAGLVQTNYEGIASTREEGFWSHLADKIPGIRPSARAFATYSNLMRANLADIMADTMTPNGNPTLEQAQDIAHMANLMTGRGSLGKYEAGAEAINLAFWSPRLQLSRFGLLTGQPLLAARSPATRRVIAKEFGRFLAGTAAIYGLGAMTADEIEKDPRSGLFGSLRYGTQWYNPLGGLSSTLAFMTQVMGGQVKDKRGRIHDIHPAGLITGPKYLSGQPLSRENDFTEPNPIGTYIRNKLAPWPGTAYNIYKGKGPTGEPVTPLRVARDLTSPISILGVAEDMKNLGVPKNVITSMLDILGIKTYGAGHWKGNVWVREHVEEATPPPTPPPAASPPGKP